MPEQFPYPDPSWSTGTVRRVGGAYPELTEEEWKAWQELPSKKGNVTAGKDRNLKGMLADNPDGFIVDRDHPGIKDIQGDAEILSIPDRDDVLFARPKPKEPLVS